MKAKRFQATIDDRFREQAIIQAQSPTPQDFTPYVEGLEHLSRHPNFSGGFDENDAKKYLWIVSDTLQHTDISAYREDLFTRQGSALFCMVVCQ